MVDGHDARTFLLSVNEIIHPEVRMIYPDAIPPVFTLGCVCRDIQVTRLGNRYGHETERRPGESDASISSVPPPPVQNTYDALEPV